MSKSKTKLLVSGCGITYTGQTARTWATIAKLAGIDVKDASGPAVSNQWILNRAFMALEADPEIKHVILQLTALGKLDVEVDSVRTQQLVVPDTKRNFVIDNIWPSSVSREHASKALWSQWLCSPGLERQDILVKLRLLRDWCQHRDIKMLVIAGYDIGTNLPIDRPGWNIMDHYRQSAWYQSGAETDVPILEYQWELAIDLIGQILPDYKCKLQQLYQQYLSCRQSD